MLAHLRTGPTVLTIMEHQCSMQQDNNSLKQNAHSKLYKKGSRSLLSQRGGTFLPCSLTTMSSQFFCPPSSWRLTWRVPSLRTSQKPSRPLFRQPAASWVTKYGIVLALHTDPFLLLLLCEGCPIEKLTYFRSLLPSFNTQWNSDNRGRSADGTSPIVRI